VGCPLKQGLIKDLEDFQETADARSLTVEENNALRKSKRNPVGKKWNELIPRLYAWMYLL
jgi:hypothetical protein